MIAIYNARRLHTLPSVIVEQWLQCAESPTTCTSLYKETLIVSQGTIHFTLNLISCSNTNFTSAVQVPNYEVVHRIGRRFVDHVRLEGISMYMVCVYTKEL